MVKNIQWKNYLKNLKRNKMTAVEKLELKLLGIISFDSEELRERYKEAIKQAKEMEKQQIIDAVTTKRLNEL